MVLGARARRGLRVALSLYRAVCVSQVTTTYRYGREEDEVMGVKFSKEIILAREQIVPPSHHGDDKHDLTPVQDKLLKKLGPNAYPFTFKFPPASPCSVTLQPGEDDSSKPLGVEYTVKTFVGDNSEDRGHKRSSVSLAIKKVSVGLPRPPELRARGCLPFRGSRRTSTS